MIRTRRQAGEGKLGCVFGVIFFLACVFIAWKMIPVKVRASELRGVIVDEAKSAGQHKNVLIRKIIMEKARELELPLEDEGLSIKRQANEIIIEADYVVPIEFPGFTYEYKFNHYARNPIF